MKKDSRFDLHLPASGQQGITPLEKHFFLREKKYYLREKADYLRDKTGYLRDKPIYPGSNSIFLAKK
jgi:hypothetical protein